MRIKKILKCKALIIALSIIATIGTLIGCTSDFFVYGMSTVDTELIVSLILFILPCFLLIVVSIKYDNKISSVLLFITLLLTSLLALKWTLETFMYLPDELQSILRYDTDMWFEIRTTLKYYGVTPLLGIIEIVSYPILTVSCVVAAISSFKTKLSKTALLINVIISIYYIIEYCIIRLTYINGQTLWLIIYSCPNFGRLAMNVTLLLIAYNRKSCYLYKNKKDKQFALDEKTLIILKEKYESGNITEEEYKEQRADIINRL